MLFRIITLTKWNRVTRAREIDCLARLGLKLSQSPLDVEAKNNGTPQRSNSNPNKQPRRWVLKLYLRNCFLNWSYWDMKPPWIGGAECIRSSRFQVVVGYQILRKRKCVIHMYYCGRYSEMSLSKWVRVVKKAKRTPLVIISRERRFARERDPPLLQVSVASPRWLCGALWAAIVADFSR